MKSRYFILSVVLSVAVIACSRNAITGRNQLSLVSDAEVQNMAVSEYKQFLSQSKVISPSASKDAEMVRRVGNRLITAIQEYYKKEGLSNELANYSWEINLVDSKDVNAWCMPGGKIVVYTGLLPVTQTEPALAVVMGHEIAHALAKHGKERMSQGLAQQLGGVALQVALANKPAATQNLFMNAYGIGSNVGVMLPFSRSNELEADKFGLRFSALAGYNPREAIPFWQRMAKAGGQKPAEFLSTHPADETRINQLQSIMDETVRDYYKPMTGSKK
ncbi:M48 family metallopeptidase [Foetidibacter luteolus]|uniref:M48 family metallopeptidase n=1 Tax=Foetidibacter luteolus TaxID=2608880 RepID=UPI00129A71E6|nr:M48 family metallopeptidase [Foetidibacter luteolus]